MTDGRRIAVLKFSGPRFDDHGLDVDVLSEIVAYKRLLQETAKELWRRKHPNRKRLPKNFDAEISLKVFEIEPGSVGVPLVRGAISERAPRLPFEHELDEAAALLQATIQNASLANGPPKALPRTIIPLFQDFGKALRPEEFIAIELTTMPANNAGGSLVRYDNEVKSNILSWATGSYTDVIDLTGEVRGADLDGLKFILRSEDGRKVPGRFEPNQERIVLVALGEHANRLLRVFGEGDFSPDGSLFQIARVDRVELIEPKALLEEHEQPPKALPVHERPIWERLAAIGADVPTDAWNDVPTDLATNVDRYLYGTKKGSH
jgi:hypothetical protein